VNKLWNIGKFIQFSHKQFQALPLPSGRDFKTNLSVSHLITPEELATMPMPERFIISRFHQMLKEHQLLFRGYQFHESAKLVYDFLWDDFADWYIEFSKFSFRPSTSQQDLYPHAVTTMKTLLYIFDLSLRTLHPYMPFVTETLFQTLPNQSTERPDLSIMTSSWPLDLLPVQNSNVDEEELDKLKLSQLSVDQQSISLFVKTQAMIRSVRNLRAEYQIPPQQKVPIVLFCSPSFYKTFQEQSTAITFLANIDPQAVQFVPSEGEGFDPVAVQALQDGKGKSLIHLVIDESIEIFVPQRAVFQVEKERERLIKQREKVQKQLTTLESRTNNPTFLAKAPKPLVEELTQKTKDCQQQLEKIEQSLIALEQSIRNS
jgi:valyl-tRNA synthetase